MPAAQYAVRESDPPWLKVAFAELGTKEFSGSASNERVEDYLASATTDRSLINDAVPWCAGFGNFCLQTGTRGLATPLQGTRSLMAKSFKLYGKPVRGQRGAIAVFDRPPDPASGHIAFMLGEGDTWIDVIGGNQSDAVTIERYNKNNLIALRWPNSYPTPEDNAPTYDAYVPETPPGVREQASTTNRPRPRAPLPEQPRQDSWVGLVVVLIVALVLALTVFKEVTHKVLDKVF